MKGILIAAIFLPLAFAIAFQVDSAQRDRAEAKWRRQEQQVAAWERDQFDRNVQTAARAFQFIRLRRGGDWMILEARDKDTEPWGELAETRVEVFEGNP